MVTCLCPKHHKCLKMLPKCQIFASLRTRITIFSELKHIMMLKKFQEMGSFGASELHQMISYLNVNNVNLIMY